MFQKSIIKFVAFYSANRDEAVRAYIKCKNIETEEAFTVIGFFILKDGVWIKENNENCSTDVLFDALNNQSEIVIDTTPSKICESLVEGTFHI